MATNQPPQDSEQNTRSDLRGSCSADPEMGAGNSSDKVPAAAQIPAPSENQDSQPKKIPTTKGHQGFVLAGAAFILFEILFVVLYSLDFWFAFDVRPFGLIAVLIALFAAHHVLRFLESPFMCRFLYSILKGAPPIVYQTWLGTCEQANAQFVGFGIRRLMWSAIDDIEVTIWGNLLFRSRALSGPDGPLDVVLKVPLAVASNADQKALLQKLIRNKPGIVLNRRAQKVLEFKDVSGTAVIQLFGAAFLIVVLLDVGYSTFNYLEMLKDFYLAKTTAANLSFRSQSQQRLDEAERIRTHPFALSWVSNKLFTQEPVASGLLTDKAEALCALGKRTDAIDALRQAAVLSPKNFRLHLRAARMLESDHQRDKAKQEIEEAVTLHKDSFLPRLYQIALTEESGGEHAAQSVYDDSVKALTEQVFGEGDRWPPGGEPFLHDVWYKDDVQFVFNRLLHLPAKEKN